MVEQINLARKDEVDTVQTNLDDHEADTSNPHSVTAAQAGAAADPHGNGAHDPNMALASDLADHEGDTTNPHSVSHGQLGGISSDDHHAKYTDSEAQSAISGASLSGGLTLGGDLVAGLNGTVTLHGHKVSVRDFSTDANGNPDQYGYIEFLNDDGVRGAYVGHGTGDTGHIDLQLDNVGRLDINGGDVNVTGGTLSEQGNRVATRTWATSSNIGHGDLSGISSDDHHAKYTDAEARTAIEGGDVDGVQFSNSEHGNFDKDGFLYWDLSAGLYVKSSNAGGSQTGGSLLWSSENFVAGDGVAVSYDSEDEPTLSFDAGSVNHNDLANISSDDHHSRYADSEAVSAADGEISAAASTLSGLDSTVNSHHGDTTNPHSTTLEQARSQGNTFGGAVRMGDNDLQIHDGSPSESSTTAVTSIEGYQGTQTGQDSPISIDFGVYDVSGNTAAEAVLSGPDSSINRLRMAGVHLDFDGEDAEMGGGDVVSPGLVDGVDVATLESDFSSHESSTSNPHSVTHSQVGAIEDAAGAVSNSNLANDTVTVAGNAVALGGTTGIAHADLGSIGASDHHTRFTDDANDRLSDIPTRPHSDLTGISNNDHHEPVTAGTMIDVTGQQVDHSDTSSQSNFSAPSGEAVTDIEVDSRGHVTLISSSEVSGGGESFEAVFTDRSSISADSATVSTASANTLFDYSQEMVVWIDMDRIENSQITVTVDGTAIRTSGRTGFWGHFYAATSFKVETNGGGNIGDEAEGRIWYQTFA